MAMDSSTFASMLQSQLPGMLQSAIIGEVGTRAELAKFVQEMFNSGEYKAGFANAWDTRFQEKQDAMNQTILGAVSSIAANPIAMDNVYQALAQRLSANLAAAEASVASLLKTGERPEQLQIPDVQ